MTYDIICGKNPDDAIYWSLALGRSWLGSLYYGGSLRLLPVRTWAGGSITVVLSSSMWTPAIQVLSPVAPGLLRHQSHSASIHLRAPGWALTQSCGKLPCHVDWELEQYLQRDPALQLQVSDVGVPCPPDYCYSVLCQRILIELTKLDPLVLTVKQPTLLSS